MVNYIDYSEYNNGTSGKYFHMFDAPWYKRLSFAHEKEFRVISESPDFNMLTDAHDLLIPVDLNLLIDNIYFSPKADKWFVKLVSNIIKKNRRNRQTLWGGCTDANPKLLLNDT